MRSKGWLLAAALVVTPVAAHAQAVLDKPHALTGHGVALVVAGRFAEAEKPLREALRIDPTLANAHYNLAIVLKNEGRFDEAVAEYHRALDGFSTESQRAQAFYGIGLAREARGDKGAWDEYLAFARPLRVEQPAVQIAEDHRDVINGVKVPGSYQKAAR
ncbi:MAG TPA: tetratricopeptide repeat protein [Polyangia bacterium]|jgi:tetratricopeptide (TPR) repeat protein